MKIHYLQHVQFEDLANIKTWAAERKHFISATKFYLHEEPPAVESFDWLIVMGGPMNIYEEERYPWLSTEKKFIERTIKSGKFVLGICLGGQLVADVLGGKITRNNYKEIGWLQVKKINEGSGLLLHLSDEFMAFHWHGDTFEIPNGATRLVESEGCANQSFEFGLNVLALQFHLESSETSIERLIENCRHDMTPGKYVRSSNEILSGLIHIPKMRTNMNLVLDEMEKRLPDKPLN